MVAMNLDSSYESTVLILSLPEVLYCILYITECAKVIKYVQQHLTLDEVKQVSDK